MLGVRFRAFPSPWTRALDFRTAENWLHRHYLHVAVVTLILLILNELYAFGTHLPGWDWLFVSGWITFLLTFKTTFLLPGKVDEVLSRLAASGVLDDSNNELGDFKQGLHESARGAARVGRRDRRCCTRLGMDSGYARRASILFAYGASGSGSGFFGWIIHRPCCQLQSSRPAAQDAGFSINVDPEYLDGVAGLRPIGRLYFFQSALVAVLGAFLAVWWFLIPLFGNRYGTWRDVYAGLLVFVILCEVLAFFRPMWSFHRVMSDKRAELLIEADQISEQAAGIKKQLRGGADEDVTAPLEDQLGRMTKRYQAIVEMPTWPVDKRIQRRFALNNLILFIPVLAQLLGASSSSGNISWKIFRNPSLVRAGSEDRDHFGSF